MKSFVLCEASSGYKWHSVLYSSKELTENLDTVYGNFEYVKSKVILSLIDELLDKGYHLFIDNILLLKLPTPFLVMKLILLEHYVKIIKIFHIS